MLATILGVHMLNALLWVLCAYIEYRYFFKILKYTGQIPPPTPSYTHEKLKFNQICAEFFLINSNV